jgi:hypothetical protein
VYSARARMKGVRGVVAFIIAVAVGELRKGSGEV